MSFSEQLWDFWFPGPEQKIRCCAVLWDHTRFHYHNVLGLGPEPTDLSLKNLEGVKVWNPWVRPFSPQTRCGFRRAIPLTVMITDLCRLLADREYFCLLLTSFWTLLFFCSRNRLLIGYWSNLFKSRVLFILTLKTRGISIVHFNPELINHKWAWSIHFPLSALPLSSICWHGSLCLIFEHSQALFSEQMNSLLERML